MDSEETWLEVTQAALYEHWGATTGHRPKANRSTWACEIAQGCRQCNEHLSLPCSLLAEANEVGLFLSTTRCDLCQARPHAVHVSPSFVSASKHRANAADPRM